MQRSGARQILRVVKNKTFDGTAGSAAELFVFAVIVVFCHKDTQATEESDAVLV